MAKTKLKEVTFDKIKLNPNSARVPGFYIPAKKAWVVQCNGVILGQILKFEDNGKKFFHILHFAINPFSFNQSRGTHTQYKSLTLAQEAFVKVTEENLQKILV